MIIYENRQEEIYALGAQVTFEAFEDGGLILKIADRTLTEFNPTACDILQLTDG